MAVTQSKRNIPTVTQAVERFINKNRAQRGVREHISVLQGARSGRVVGRKAAGTALAMSPLGPLRFDRVSGDEFATWFHDRHPDHLAASTRKRGRSSLRQLLLFAIASGWADESVLAALPPVTASPARREWLRPEQLVALDRLVTDEEFTRGQHFMWLCLANTGLRTEELVGLKPQALNVIDGTLKVRGKGRGDGKDRVVPIKPSLPRRVAGVRARAPVTAIELALPTDRRAVRSRRAVRDRVRHDGRVSALHTEGGTNRVRQAPRAGRGRPA
jgi:integrase